AGPLAQFGRAGIVNDLAARLTAEFAKNLEARLDSAAGEAAAEPAPAPELDAGALVFAVIWQRIKAFLARLFGRG
ncbi:MAG: carbon monoxide dehydrogenase, partial [Alphaproteobacteria bacterium]